MVQEVGRTSSLQLIARKSQDAMSCALRLPREWRIRLHGDGDSQFRIEMGVRYGKNVDSRTTIEERVHLSRCRGEEETAIEIHINGLGRCVCNGVTRLPLNLFTGKRLRPEGNLAKLVEFHVRIRIRRVRIGFQVRSHNLCRDAMNTRKGVRTDGEGHECGYQQGKQSAGDDEMQSAVFDHWKFPLPKRKDNSRVEDSRNSTQIRKSKLANSSKWIFLAA